MSDEKKLLEEKYVRFPNESNFILTPVDMTKFIPSQEFDDQIFGFYCGTYISIKK